MLNTLPKSERLSSFKEIDNLIKKGASLFHYPFKVVYILGAHSNEQECGNKILISVPKRNFKRAVKRNYIKRRIRESYRLNKGILCQRYNNINILFVYVGKQVAEYHFIETKIKDVLVKLDDIISNGQKEN